MIQNKGFSSIALIIIAILVLGGSYWVWKNQAVAPISNLDTSTWKTYRNEEYGFTVDIPNNFDLYISQADPARMTKIDPQNLTHQMSDGIFHITPARIYIENPYRQFGNNTASLGISIAPLSLFDHPLTSFTTLDEFLKKHLETQDYNDLEPGKGNVVFKKSKLNGQDVIQVILDGELLDTNAIHKNYLFGIGITPTKATNQEIIMMEKILQTIKFI